MIAGCRHVYQADPRACGYFAICWCGLWPLHHVHTGDTAACTCDACNTATIPNWQTEE